MFTLVLTTYAVNSLFTKFFNRNNKKYTKLENKDLITRYSLALGDKNQKQYYIAPFVIDSRTVDEIRTIVEKIYSSKLEYDSSQNNLVLAIAIDIFMINYKQSLREDIQKKYSENKPNFSQHMLSVCSELKEIKLNENPVVYKKLLKEYNKLSAEPIINIFEEYNGDISKLDQLLSDKYQKQTNHEKKIQ